MSGVDAPSRVEFTEHARWQLTRRRMGLDLIESVVLEAHQQRQRNSGRADWRLRHRGVIVIYDWPGGDGDETTALVRSAWRR